MRDTVHIYRDTPDEKLRIRACIDGKVFTSACIHMKVHEFKSDELLNNLVLHLIQKIRRAEEK